MITGLHYLRAIAAMLVVGHHAVSYFPRPDEWTSFGEAGVDVFFVISGFVMAWTTRHAGPTPTQAAFDFLVRRLIRVVPLYWLALLWITKRDLVHLELDPAVLLDFVFLPRFNPDHFNHIFPVLVPGWTINYEMFFYAVFAISLLFGKYQYAIIFPALAFLITLGHLVEYPSAFGQFYTSSIMAEFLYGILICKWVQRHGQDHHPRLAWLALISGFVGLALLWPGDHIPRAYVAGPLAALIVYAGILAFNGWHVPWLHRLADASFSIYLTHLFTFRLSRTLLQGLPPDQPSPVAMVVAVGVQLAVAAAVGLLVHRWIEQPLTRYLTRRFLKPRRLATEPGMSTSGS
ncbi:acyltransferase [Aquabacterium sp. CECT 9606]|uniref:acyltransferase family protein n=1 Tax=Aquabacterium sp. CECT 9606 TaxID=2845822 RepID=UPI00211377D7|nr:acyltransferase [Aquabacterium sp. CECT 9606]